MAIDKNLGTFADVSSADSHCFVITGELREFLSAALGVDWAKGPERRLWMIIIGVFTMAAGEGADEFVSGNWYPDDTNLNTSNSYATITDFNSTEGDEIIVEIPSNPADGNYTLSVAENPAGSGTYDVSLTQTGGGSTTVVAKVTGGGAGLSTASDGNVKLVKQ